MQMGITNALRFCRESSDQVSMMAPPDGVALQWHSYEAGTGDQRCGYECTRASGNKNRVRAPSRLPSARRILVSRRVVGEVCFWPRNHRSISCCRSCVTPSLPNDCFAAR